MDKFAIGVVLLLAATILVTPALATDVACASPQPLNAAMGTGGSNGCTYVDNNFLNFLATAPTGTGDASFPTVIGGFAPNIEFTPSGTSPDYTLDFTTTGAPNAGAFTCNANSWCHEGGSIAVTASQSFAYDATTTSTGYTGLSLTEGSLQLLPILVGNVITTEEQFCLGGASVAGCAAANLGYIEIQETSVAPGTAYSAVYTVCTPGAGGCTVSNPGAAQINFGAQAQIGIEDTVTITTTTDEDRAIFLNSFDNNFQINPEPSTLVLLGAGLAGFGILHYRRKKA